MEDFQSVISSTGLKPPQVDIGKTISDLTEKAKPQFERMSEIEGRQKDAVTSMIRQGDEFLSKLESRKPPEPPKLEKLPEVPDTQYKDPTQALGSMASVLAMLGSLKTRAPLTAALNAGAAAMEGFHKGDQERVKLERDKFHDNLEKALKQNQSELNQYQAALEASKFDITKASAQWRVIAGQNQNHAMLAAIEMGDPQRMYQLYMDTAKISNEMLKTQTTHFDRLRQIQSTEDLRKATLAQTGELARERIGIARERLDIERDKIKGKMPSAKDEMSRKALSSNISKLDEVIGKVASGTTGVMGTANRWYERIAPQLGVPISGTPANDFETTIGVIKGAMYKELVGPGNISKSEWARIDGILKGLSPTDSEPVTRNALTQVRRILQENLGLKPAPPEIVSEAKDLKKNGYSAQQLTEYSRSRGFDLKEEDLQ